MIATQREALEAARKSREDALKATKVSTSEDSAGNNINRYDRRPKVTF